MNSKIYRMVDVASASGVSVQTLYSALKSGAIPPGDLQIGNRRCWSEEGMAIVKEWYSRPRGWRRDHTYRDLDLNNNMDNNKESIMDANTIEWSKSRSEPRAKKAEYKGYSLSVMPGAKGWFLQARDGHGDLLEVASEWPTAIEAQASAPGLIDKWIEVKEAQ